MSDRLRDAEKGPGLFTIPGWAGVGAVEVAKESTTAWTISAQVGDPGEHEQQDQWATRMQTRE
jgi:hypothetical protein